MQLEVHFYFKFCIFLYLTVCARLKTYKNNETIFFSSATKQYCDEYVIAHLWKGFFQFRNQKLTCSLMYITPLFQPSTVPQSHRQFYKTNLCC